MLNQIDKFVVHYKDRKKTKPLKAEKNNFSKNQKHKNLMNMH